MKLTEAELKLLRVINSHPGGRVMVTMPETEAAGARLVKLGLVRGLSEWAFVSNG